MLIYLKIKKITLKSRRKKIQDQIIENKKMNKILLNHRFKDLVY